MTGRYIAIGFKGHESVGVSDWSATTADIHCWHKPGAYARLSVADHGVAPSCLPTLKLVCQHRYLWPRLCQQLSTEAEPITSTQPHLRRAYTKSEWRPYEWKSN